MKNLFYALPTVLFCLLISCKSESQVQYNSSQEDIYLNTFQDNYFRQLTYVSQYKTGLFSLIDTNTSLESGLIFWLKNGDCDSCIEQQIQFLKLILGKDTRPVVVFADYESKRVFSSVQSSFDFVEMRLVKIPDHLSESLGSPFYVSFDKNDHSVSIYKPIPERASWTKRYLESIGAL